MLTKTSVASLLLVSWYTLAYYVLFECYSLQLIGLFLPNYFCLPAPEQHKVSQLYSPANQSDIVTNERLEN